jgi:hypothetical protein
MKLQHSYQSKKKSIQKANKAGKTESWIENFVALHKTTDTETNGRGGVGLEVVLEVNLG